MAASVTVTSLAQRTDTNVAVVHGLCIGGAIDTFALDDVYFSTVGAVGPWLSTPVDAADSEYLWPGIGSALGVAYRLPLSLPQNASGQIWIKVESTHVGSLDTMSGYVDLHPSAYNTTPQGTWNIVAGALYTEGYIYNQWPSDADEIVWHMQFDTGTYTLIGTMYTTSASGIADISIDGSVVATFDTYSVGSVNSVRFVQTGIEVTKGLLDVSLRVNGKNPASSDYSIRMNNLALFRTA